MQNNLNSLQSPRGPPCHFFPMPNSTITQPFPKPLRNQLRTYTITRTFSMQLAQATNLACISEPVFRHVPYRLVKSLSTFCFVTWEKCSMESSDYGSKNLLVEDRNNYRTIIGRQLWIFLDLWKRDYPPSLGSDYKNAKDFPTLTWPFCRNSISMFSRTLVGTFYRKPVADFSKMCAGYFRKFAITDAFRFAVFVVFVCLFVLFKLFGVAISKNHSESSAAECKFEKEALDG